MVIAHDTNKHIKRREQKYEISMLKITGQYLFQKGEFLEQF